MAIVIVEGEVTVVPLVKMEPVVVAILTAIETITIIIAQNIHMFYSKGT